MEDNLSLSHLEEKSSSQNHNNGDGHPGGTAEVAVGFVVGAVVVMGIVRTVFVGALLVSVHVSRGAIKRIGGLEEIGEVTGGIDIIQGNKVIALAISSDGNTSRVGGAGISMGSSIATANWLVDFHADFGDDHASTNRGIATVVAIAEFIGLAISVLGALELSEASDGEEREKDEQNDFHGRIEKK